MLKLYSPLRYPGGKSKVVNKILKYLPNEFKEYREPFVGGGSVFLKIIQRYNNKVIKINDLNEDLYCFWKELKNDPVKLYEEIKYLKHTYTSGYSLYQHCKNNMIDNDFKKAVRYYILNRITFSGTVDSGGYSENSYKYRFTDNIINRIKSFINILEKVDITCTDYKEVIKQNGKDVIIYLDPPYINNKYSKLYGDKGHLHKYFNHEEFIREIKNNEHKWILTIDNNQIVINAFKDRNKYNVYPLVMQYGMDNAKGNDPKKIKELIITNFLPFKLIRKIRKELLYPMQFKLIPVKNV
ncbi:MAG: DNA adenine methylase [Candidatus Hodarchaeota archaeon]